MPLDLPDQSICFIDANIFYYHFVETPDATELCTAFLERVVAGKLVAFTSVHLLAETLHKVMLAEAVAKFGMDRAGLVRSLQRQPDRIRQLSAHVVAAAELPKMGVQVLSPGIDVLRAAARISQETSLLTNDALTVAMMRKVGATNLISNDDDFDAVEGLNLWKPR